ncbi:MAG: Tm-1-like ATP-binding domain-containing protein [Spirochaetales bacterium]
MKKVYVVGTFDTKAEELTYVAKRVGEAGAPVVTVDVSSQPASPGAQPPADISNAEVARNHPSNAGFLGNTEDRGSAVSMMSEALGEFLVARERDDLGGVIGIGGSGNTALVTAAMRRLSVGLPKLMVSTVASGDVGPYVGPNDIAMMYSVTDIAGINRISRAVLGNAAHAIAGMVANEIPAAPSEKPTLGMTMFGVTTPCVTAVREKLEREFDPLVFHATGTGGQSMEKLIDSGMISHVIDITLTEVCDLHMGGVMSAGADRLGAIIRAGIPYVGSVGALDMVNFAAFDTVPEKYQHRNLYKHNENVTLMRTTVEENREMGRWIGARLNQMTGPVRFLLPEKGVSLIDAEGQPFHDPAADEALFSAIEETVEQTADRAVTRHPYNINDPEFADALISAFRDVWRNK